LLATTLVTTAQAASASEGIVIDGDLADWQDSQPQVSDADDGLRVDLRAVTVRHDPESVFVRLALARKVNLQMLPGSTLKILIDADRDPSTGGRWPGVSGIDTAVEFSPLRKRDSWSGRYGALISTFNKRGSSKKYSAFDISLLVSPTTSATDFEIRLPREDPVLSLQYPGFDLTAVVTGEDGLIIDQSLLLSYRFADHPTLPPRVPRSADKALARPSGDVLRVLTWNIGDYHFNRDFNQDFKRYGPMLGLLQPDILLFDEAPDDVSDRKIRKLLGQMNPDVAAGDWNIIIGRGGGRQRGVVASQLDLTELEGFAKLHYPDEVVEFAQKQGTPIMLNDMRSMVEDAMPVAAASVRWGGQDLFLVVTDFQCCGRDGSPEDQFRVMQAQTLRKALEKSLARHRPGGLILTGDFNLVGSRSPLDELVNGCDLDGSDLTTVQALQLDQRSNATYGISGPFPPGQLDFVLYSDTTLGVANAFVFDTRDVDPELLARSGASPEDSTHTSDHLPIVVDFRLVAARSKMADTTTP
jgi:hypothetical protein